MNQYSPENEDWTKALFGREIVSVDHPKIEIERGWGWWDAPTTISSISSDVSGTPPRPNSTEYNTEQLVLTLDDGTELLLNAELDCCAGGEITYQNLVGGRVMSVTTEEHISPQFSSTDESDDYYYDTTSTYKVFILKDGLPGEITVNSHESNGYYGTGFTLSVRKQEK